MKYTLLVGQKQYAIQTVNGPEQPGGDSTTSGSGMVDVTANQAITFISPVALDPGASYLITNGQEKFHTIRVNLCIARAGEYEISGNIESESESEAGAGGT
jgi:hypothetical protein